MINRYNFNKTTELKVNGNSIDKDTNSRNIDDFSDFTIIIRQKNI